MRRIAIITARGGSKRIPKKNIRMFCGKPILAYSVEAALETELFDVVMVSTDSEEIAQTARDYGAEVPFMRSAATSDDYATTDDVLREVLEEYGNRNMMFDEMVCLYPTAPFVTGEKLKKAVALLEDNDADEVLPVVAYSFPPQRANIISDGLFTGHKMSKQICRCFFFRNRPKERNNHISLGRFISSLGFSDNRNNRTKRIFLCYISKSTWRYLRSCLLFRQNLNKILKASLKCHSKEPHL